MTDAVSRVRFTWNAAATACRASAFDAADKLLGDVVVEFPEDVRNRIWRARGHAVRLRIEEAAERHLRSTLELRY